MNRGAWTAMEDKILTSYIKVHGEGKWRNLPKRADHSCEEQQLEMCNYEPGFLVAAGFGEFGPTNGDAKVDTGYDNNMWLAHQDHSLPSDDPITTLECWTADCAEDNVNASMDLDSLAFLLDSEEWP
ncbi:hypothetical protein JRO89_XS03G0296800 [Xanthoceras sorbifolium]|uniref:Uncharacterized protein n=1 Tax=Xanthoceras sorbifolium TaxID=99658 RepID=A0ABQ8ICR4_9ROSI|nr:hypothetical protein JRO89_XS03G0296800 [Xanthoceras sorbifolium]